MGGRVDLPIELGRPIVDPALVEVGEDFRQPFQELGLQLQYWRMMSEDYAFTISAGWGFFNETDQPGQGAAAGAPELGTMSCIGFRHRLSPLVRKRLLPTVLLRLGGRNFL